MHARAFLRECPPRPPWYLWPEYLRYACTPRPSLTGVPPTPSVLGSWVVFWFAPSGGFEPTTFEFRVGRLNHSAKQTKGSCEHPPSNIYTPRPIYDFHPRPLPRAQAKFLTHASPYLAVMAHIWPLCGDPSTRGALRVKYQSARAPICGGFLGAPRHGARGLDFGRSPNFLFWPFFWASARSYYGHMATPCAFFI